MFGRRADCCKVLVVCLADLLLDIGVGPNFLTGVFFSLLSCSLKIWVTPVQLLLIAPTTTTSDQKELRLLLEHWLLYIHFGD
jgi:hypothetical protein